MESLLFAINAVLPIAIMVALGYILKKVGFMPPDFSKRANKIVFRICLPAMLFLNVYKIDGVADISFSYAVYVLAAVMVIFLVSIPIVIKLTVPARRGALLQSAFRSNYALIGIPLASALYGAEGVAVASLLSAIIVPAFNVLAVISLSIFSDAKPNFKKILTDIFKNPLIIGVIAGLFTLLVRGAFENYGVSFRLSDVTPVYTVLGYLSNIATPLALLVLGAQFEFSAVAELKKEIIYGTLVRSLIVPLFGIGFAYIFFRGIWSGAHFATFVAVFATPVAVSSVPMAQEMNNDAALAGQLVVFTTLMSALSVGIAAFALKALGVFA